ncbi:type II toxin-antitoxin system VapC family toxin [Aestuariimicrobium sp. Y1814]|uniref:type II toxin-antitoxin system VapC family toxin n=1 Tax=Aestuariimicrobium sp. Y1814 TaxID=3418742 RepID=UPI003DA78E78
MIVIDASAMVEALVGRQPSDEPLEALAGDVDAPHLLDVEVLSALRGLLLGGRLSTTLAEQALQNFQSMSITRHPMTTLTGRVWQLRHQFTTYDASYIALAEALGAPLYTCDAKLATRGHTADVRLLD